MTAAPSDGQSAVDQPAEARAGATDAPPPRPHSVFIVGSGLIGTSNVL
jgi:hypothetical protein